MKKTPTLVRVFQYVVLILAAFFAIYPIWFAALAALRSGNSLFTLNLAGMFVPLEFDLSNFQKLFTEPNAFLYWLGNSVFVALATTVFSLVVTTSAAFALSRFRFRGRETFLVFLLALSTFPGLLNLTAIAQLLTAFGLYNQYLGLIFAYTSGALVFCTWNLKGYFDSIPIDLEEAARIDGCGPVQAFLQVALPLVTPAIAVTALLSFLSGWGDFVFASVLMTDNEKKLVVPALYQLANDRSVPWGEFAAGAIIVIIPTLIVFLLVQKQFESGLMVGGVKG
jgi:arabinogalactan oligomer / maltooligosaccharide transport system permease protein